MNHEKTSQNTESAPKSKKDLKTIAKKALFGITAAATIGAASGCAEATPKPADKQQYMEAVDKYLTGKQQLSVDFSEDGTTINFVEYGDTRYSLKDTDNDTLIESGSVTRAGKSAEFSENDGLAIDRAELFLSHKLNTGQ